MFPGCLAGLHILPLAQAGPCAPTAPPGGTPRTRAVLLLLRRSSTRRHSDWHRSQASLLPAQVRPPAPGLLTVFLPAETPVALVCRSRTHDGSCVHHVFPAPCQAVTRWAEAGAGPRWRGALSARGLAASRWSAGGGPAGTAPGWLVSVGTARGARQLGQLGREPDCLPFLSRRVSCPDVSVLVLGRSRLGFPTSSCLPLGCGFLLCGLPRLQGTLFLPAWCLLLLPSACSLLRPSVFPRSLPLPSAHSLASRSRLPCALGLLPGPLYLMARSGPG